MPEYKPGSTWSERRIAELEAALTKLLQATSDQVVMRPSQQDAWRDAERVLRADRFRIARDLANWEI